MEIKFVQESNKHAENIIIVLDSTLAFPKFTQDIEKSSEVQIRKITELREYKGKYGELFAVFSTSKTIRRIFVVGAGQLAEFNEFAALKLGAKIYAHLHSQKVSTIKLCLPTGMQDKKVQDETLFNMLLGMLIKSYKFNKYFTKKDEDNNQAEIEKIEVLSGSATDSNSKFAKVKAIAEAVTLSKNLALEPANVMNPIAFAKACTELKKSGLEVTVLDEKQMGKLNMNALLGVGQGSVNRSRLVIMRWNGAKKDKKPIAFVGKGVTFDTGGLSLKSANHMIGMKYDKTGAAVVTGLMKLFALRKTKVNAIGVIGLVENMPSGSAQRPEDVVRSMSGQTIEILNTDAEGRLVLADALWYTQEKFKPEFMIDLATLTGAIRVCLADEYAGLFSNDDTLSDRIYKSGLKSGEKVWRLPLTKEYDKMIDSKVADVQNVGSEKGGGSITAAQFLKRFVNNCTWAHLDIAAVATTTHHTDLHNLGSTAFGVRLLHQLVVDYYEDAR